MKFACLLALLLPTLAVARPRFDIPNNAYRSQARCSIERSTRDAQGNGWTDWLNRKDSESFDFTHWTKAEGVNTIEDRGASIKLTQTKDLSEDSLEIRRQEKVEDWVKRYGKWSVKTHLIQITIVRRQTGPNLRIERWKDGRVFHWETSTSPEGQVTKNLLNPEILNTKERQVGLLRTVCRY